MTSRRVLVVLGVIAVVSWVVVARYEPDARPRTPRPERLLDLSAESVESIVVVDLRTGARVAVEGPTFDLLAPELSPLFAIRSFADVEEEFGLDRPRARLEVSARSGGRVPHVTIGAPNFDRTGYYVRVEGRGGAALVASKVGDAVYAVLGERAG